MSSRVQSEPDAGFMLSFNDGVLGLVGLGVLLFTAVLWTAHGPNVERTDFSLTYVGAKLVHEGMGRDLYSPELQKQLRDSLFQHPVPLFFEHPPFEALLLSPLAASSFRSAYLIWGLTNATIWLAVIIFLRRYLPWPGEALGYLFMWLLFAPLGVALYQGQSSLLLLAAFALSFVLLKRDTDFAAGIALGFGLLKFQFVLPFALIFLFRRKWIFVGGFAVSAFALALVSIAAVGWKGLLDYARFLLTIGNNPQNISLGSGVDMPTIHGFIFATLGRKLSGSGLNIIVAGSSVALLGWVAMHWERVRNDCTFDLMFAAAVAASLVSGSHMFTHDFAPLALPIFLAATHLSHGRLSSATSLRPRLAITVALVLFWTFPIYFLFVKWHYLYLMAPVLLLFVWGIIQATTISLFSAEEHTAVARS